MKRLFPIIALFILVGVAIYGRSVLHNEFVKFDDTLLITDNLSVLKAGSFFSFVWAFSHFDPELYIPITFLSLQLDTVIGGIHPFIFHADNLLQHTVNALLLSWIFFLLLKRKDLSVLLGLLFLVHPLNTEAVAWASARKDILSTLFFLASVGTYLHYKESTTKKMQYVSIALFVLGLLSKVTVAPLPIVLLLLDWRQQQSLRISDLFAKTGYILAAIPIGLIAILGKDAVIERSPLGTILLLIPRSTLFYLQKLVAPFNLTIFYPFPEDAVHILHPALLVSALLFFGTAALLWVKRKTLPNVAIGFAMFFLLLIPSFFQFFRGHELYLASDRYAYLPFIGILLMIAPFLQYALLKQRQVTLVIVSGVLCGLSYLSFQQSKIWRSTQTLFTQSLEYHESFLSYEKIGLTLMMEGKTDEAIPKLVRSIELFPNSAAFVHLGVIAMQKGLVEDAKQYYEEAITLSPENAQPHINLSKILWDEKQHSLAIAHAEKAVEYHPWNMMALGNLASMYTLTNQNEKAREVIAQILDIDPSNERVQPLLKKLGASN